jgi:hypothetical protein
MDAQLHIVATAWVLADPAHGGYRLLPAGIHQHPAPAVALVEQILDAAIQQLAQLSRAGGLLQVPEQGGAAAV